MKSWTHQPVKLLHLVIAVILIFQVMPEADALEVSGKPVPEADIQLLPPVCKLILVEMPGIHQKGGNTSTKFGYLLDRPEYAMARNNPHLHHYCWSLVNRMRYFRAHSSSERGFWFARIMDDTSYVLQNSPKDWPYFNVILLEQGFMMILQNDYKGSLAKAKEALEHNPDEERAYALEFDAYMGMQKKEQAISVAQEGLKRNPRSQILLSRLEQLGIAPSTTATASKLEEQQGIQHDTKSGSSVIESGTGNIDPVPSVPSRSKSDQRVDQQP